MQITRLKLLSDFRSLRKGFEMNFFTNIIPDQSISPTCIVGKNGSGKSNLLELVCEIFYYLDSLLLDFPSDNLLSKKKFGFEVEYMLNTGQFDPLRDWLDPKLKWDPNKVHIKIIKKSNEKPEYNFVDLNGKSSPLKNEEDTIRELNKKQKYLLPKRLIGYSSGLNELISGPFIKMQFHYFHEYQARLAADILDSFEDGRLYYMNFDSNAAILLSNYLLQKDNVLNVLNDELGLQSLDSFRLSIQFGNLIDVNSESNDDKGVADVTDFFKKEIEFLEKLSTSQANITTKDISSSSPKTNLILDYKVTDATKAGFAHYFGDADGLHNFLLRLNLINIFKIADETREKVRNSGRGQNVLNLLPKLANEDLIFKIENIVLKKKDSKDKIFYNRLSDGEHQFIQIMGTFMILNDPKSLFILDEPETHLNPKWRSKLVSTLNKIQSANDQNDAKETTFSKSSKSEMILSTHSPFILSDSHNVKVWKFTIANGKPNVDYVKFKTFGASFSVLLDEVLEKEESLSDMSNDYIVDIRNVANEIDLNKPDAGQILATLKDRVLLLGESPEKFELYSYLNNLSRKINDSDL